MNQDERAAVAAELLGALPRCGGCLVDLPSCESMQPIGCGHFYCQQCFLCLEVGANTYKCALDDKVFDIGVLPQTVTVQNRLSKILTSEADPLAALASYLGPVHFSDVPCRDMYTIGTCASGPHCKFSHDHSAHDKLRKFKSVQRGNECWACEKCLLTVSKKLNCCPVCSAKQPRMSAMFSPSELSSPAVYQTFDQSVQTDDDRPRFRPLLSSDKDLESIEEQLLAPQNRSVCCALQ